MAGEEAANRYAQAVFQIALEQGTIDRWRTELDDIAKVLVESEAANLLADDNVPAAERYGIIERVLDVSPLALNLAKLLIKKDRTGAARGIAEAFEAMADEHAGIAKARLTTAIELSDEQRKAIEEQLSRSLGKTVRATSEVDPAILGGIVIRVGDQLVDGSIRTRLRLLRRDLQQSTT